MVHEFTTDNGQTIYLKTDFSVISKICNKFDYKLQDFAKATEHPEQLEYLFGKALERGFQLEKKSIPFSEDAYSDILSELFAEFMESFNKDCLMLATTKKQRAEVEDKKKVKQ